jgi:hypothetical protein
MDVSYRRFLEGLLQRLAPASLAAIEVGSAREPTWIVSRAGAP